MNIRVKLYASLAEYLPSDAIKNEIDVAFTEGATPATVIAKLGLPENMCHMVLVNGVYVAPRDRTATTLKDGDHFAAWPPVAGG